MPDRAAPEPPPDASAPTDSPAPFAVVIGAGPAGSTAARELLRAGLGPVTLLDRARFPRIKPCAGGLSSAALGALDRLGLLEAVRPFAHVVRGALLQAPSERAVRLGGGEGTWIVPRNTLDRLLVDAAAAAGATFQDGLRVQTVSPGPDGRLEVRADDGRAWRPRWVVLATGGGAGLNGLRLPHGALVTMTGWYRGVRHEPHVVEMYFDRELAPHYGWLFPEGDDRVNIGLCLDGRHRRGQPVSDIFERFLERRFGERLAGATSLRPPRGHPIAAADRVPRSGTPGVLLAGEAAHLANHSTGEGIFHALESGRLAAEAIRRGHTRGWSQDQVGHWHHRALRRRFGLGLLLAGRITRVAPPAMNAAAWVAQHPFARSLLERLLAHV